MRASFVFIAFLVAALLVGCVEEPLTDELAGDELAGDELAGDELTGEEGAASAAAEESAALAGCTLYAAQPYWSSGYLFGGGSWSGCPANASITVVLRQDISWWPDRTLASGSKSGSSGWIDLSYPCGTDFDPIKVFVETRYGSKKVPSARSIVPCG